MNIRERFLKLIEYTTPFGKEYTLLKYLPENLQKDEFGNYFIEIGQSKNMFVCHLDNVTKKEEKVNYIIDGDIIKTDGTTILGADNKAGVCVLSYMIENNISGLYYFFLGEEPTAPEGGLWGSKRALNKYFEKFKNYDTCIAFDRKQYGSIISRQIATNCCSSEFIESITKEFSKQNLIFKKDTSGYYTDSAVFMWIIPECTNLSVGVFGEHSKKEYQDLNYLEKIANAAIKVDWSNLTINRNISNKPNYSEKVITSSNISNYEIFKKQKNKVYSKLFTRVSNLLDDYRCINIENFKPGIKMIFSDWFDENKNQLNIVIDYDEKIILDNKKFNDFNQFKKYYILTYNYNILQELDSDELYDTIIDWYDKNYIDDKHYDKSNDRYILSFDEFKKIVEEDLYVDFNDFKDYFNMFNNNKRFNWIEIDNSKKLIYLYDTRAN